MKSWDEIEAGICKGMVAFEQEYTGRGSEDIRAHVIGDVVIVRLQGVLTAQLMRTARSVLQKMVIEVTGVQVMSLHHDVSTVTGEEVVPFISASWPSYRESKKKRTVLPSAATTANRSREDPSSPAKVPKYHGT